MTAPEPSAYQHLEHLTPTNVHYQCPPLPGTYAVIQAAGSPASQPVAGTIITTMMALNAIAIATINASRFSKWDPGIVNARSRIPERPLALQSNLQTLPSCATGAFSYQITLDIRVRATQTLITVVNKA